MDTDEIFKAVQNALREPPMLLIGSGHSAGFGLPGMSDLATYLKANIDPKFHVLPSWIRFQDNLDNGQDLETALSSITLEKEVLDDIRKKTWEAVSEKDIKLFEDIIISRRDVPLSRLINHFCAAHPQKIDIVTTNYDRVVEYACDKAGCTLYTGFTGYYSKQYQDKFEQKNAVKLIKVHGSLDVFVDPHGVTVNIPLQRTIPEGLIPEIITPGLSKFESVLTGTPRKLLHKADEAINAAKSFLCIGYGFNDTQIQENVIQKLREGTPLVLITKKVSDNTTHILKNNSNNYIYICENDNPSESLFCINGSYSEIENTYWTVEGLMRIIA